MIGTALLLAVLAAPPAGEGGANVWLADYGKALAAAREGNRILLLELVTSWCQYCGKMEKETFGDPRVQEATAAFVLARVDAEVDHAAALRYRPVGFPTIVFATGDGTEILSVQGYRDAEAFLTVARAMAERGPELAGHLATLDREPGNVAAREALGTAYLELGLADRAAPHLQAALDRAPAADVPRLTLLRARAARQEEDWAKAAKLLTRLVQSAPDGPLARDAWEELARVYEAWGKKGKAEEARAALRAR